MFCEVVTYKKNSSWIT